MMIATPTAYVPTTKSVFHGPNSNHMVGYAHRNAPAATTAKASPTNAAVTVRRLVGSNTATPTSANGTDSRPNRYPGCASEKYPGSRNPYTPAPMIKSKSPRTANATPAKNRPNPEYTSVSVSGSPTYCSYRLNRTLSGGVVSLIISNVYTDKYKNPSLAEPPNRLRRRRIVQSSLSTTQ